MMITPIPRSAAVQQCNRNRGWLYSGHTFDLPWIYDCDGRVPNADSEPETRQLRAV
jgi:hypothetical protein